MSCEGSSNNNNKSCSSCCCNNNKGNGDNKAKLPGKVKIIVTESNGKTSYTSFVDSGLNLMEAIRDDPTSPIDMEGVCSGEQTCSTCHVYVDDKWLDKVNTLCPKAEKEEDTLDVALQVNDNSRLACAIVLTEELDGLEVRKPKATRDMRSRFQ